MNRDEKYEWVSKNLYITIPKKHQPFVSECINSIPFGLTIIGVVVFIFFTWDVLLWLVGSIILSWVIFGLIMLYVEKLENRD